MDTETLDSANPPTAKVRLSESTLWTFQREFYSQEGMEAWRQKIPFFSTSNVFIARSYATILTRFMQDWSEQHESNQTHGAPFYILELGTGTGMFSFYLLRQLHELHVQLGLPERSFVYVMSDFVEKNVSFWRTHPALSEFIQDGSLGFAHFEIGVSDRISIELQGVADAQCIDVEHPCSRPLLVIANYIFDSLPCDVFRIAEGQLQEAVTRPNIRPNTNVEMNIGQVMDDAGFDFTYQPAVLPYYQDADYNAILSGYQQTLREANFLFPFGCLDTIKSLVRISAGRMFLLATDKAYGRNHDVYMMQKPDIVLHNAAFSMTVNFHAIGEYARLSRGTCCHQSAPGQINTSVFTFGFELSSLRETQHAIAYAVDVAGPAHLFNIFTHFERIKESCSAEEIHSYLSILHWDPYVLNTCLDVLVAGIGQLHLASVTSLAAGIHRSASMFYFIPGSPSIVNNAGAFFQSIGDYDTAIHYYQLSVAYYGKQDFTSYNMGLCHFSLQDYHAALQHFKEALALGFQDSIVLKGWIMQAQEELEQGAL